MNHRATSTASAASVTRWAPPKIARQHLNARAPSCTCGRPRRLFAHLIGGRGAVRYHAHARQWRARTMSMPTLAPRR